jgi:hypothetical protein
MLLPVLMHTDKANLGLATPITILQDANLGAEKHLEAGMRTATSTSVQVPVETLPSINEDRSCHLHHRHCRAKSIHQRLEARLVDLVEGWLFHLLQLVLILVLILVQAQELLLE